MALETTGEPTSGLVHVTLDSTLKVEVLRGPGFRARARSALVTRFGELLDAELPLLDEEGRAFPE